MANIIGEFLTMFNYDTKGADQVVSASKKIESSQKGIADSTKRATASGKDFISAMRRAIIVAPVWMVLRSLMSGIRDIFRNSLKFLIDWEKQMADLRTVLSGTNKEFADLSKTLLSLTAAYGLSTEQVMVGAKMWAQQGRTFEEINSLMRITAKYALTTGKDMTTSISDLTNIMENYGFKADNAMKIVDSLAQVEDKNAVSASVLADALREVSAVSAGVGINFDKMLGIITATHVATRASGTKIGSAWVSIFSRMSKQATNTVQNLANIPMFIDEAGNSTKTNTGNFRNFGAVLDELSVKMTILNEKDKLKVLQDLAGIRRYALLKSALDQWSKGIQSTIDSLNSFGEADRDINIILETTDAKLKKVTATWMEFVAATMSTSGMKSGLDFLQRLISDWSKISRAGMGGFGYFEGKTQDIQTQDKLVAFANEQVGKYQDMATLSNQLLSLTQRRNELVKSGVSETSKEIQTWDKLIKPIKEALQIQKELAGLKGLTAKEIPNYLIGQQPEIKQKGIEALVSRDMETKVKKLGEAFTDSISTYNQLAMRSNSKLLEGYQTGEEYAKRRLAIQTEISKMEIFPKDYIGPGADKATQNDKERLNILKAQRDELDKMMINWRERVGMRVGGKDEVEQRAKLTQLYSEQIDKAQKLNDTVIKETTLDQKINQMKVLAIEQRLDELDIMKAQLKMEEAFSASEVDKQDKRKEALKLRIAEMEATRKQATEDLLMKHEVNILKIRGASEKTILEITKLLKEQLGIKSTNLVNLQQELSLEEEILNTKLKGADINQDTIDWWKDAQKYGDRFADDMRAVQEGKKDFFDLTRKEQQIAQVEHPQLYETAQARKYMEQRGGVPVGEMTDEEKQNYIAERTRKIEERLYGTVEYMDKATAELEKLGIKGPQPKYMYAPEQIAKLREERGIGGGVPQSLQQIVDSFSEFAKKENLAPVVNVSVTLDGKDIGKDIAVQIETPGTAPRQAVDQVIDEH